MKLYNTMSRQVEDFRPKGEPVTVYVCGITPYDTTHLGHAFTYATADILIRYLEFRGLKVRYAQNVTDIDDDILRKARQLGVDWRELGNRWTSFFIQDMQSLNIRPPDFYPRATEVIPEIIAAIKDLLKAGVAYEAGGSVYYHVDRWPEFGMLSQIPRSEMLTVANERGNHPEDPHKIDPLDFVLWQAQAPEEPAWDSPWGPGRPGWHIECSTMSHKFLGGTVDVHGGGEDLCFPHHECEIAQVLPVNKDKPFVRYWMHTAMVRHEGEKISKSLGNLVMVRDLLQDYSADGIRVYLANHHYREQWEYDAKDLDKAERLAGQLREAVTAHSGDGPKLNPEPAWAAFMSDMDNDLDSPSALKVLDDFSRQILDAALAKRDIREAQSALRDFAKVLGLRLDEAVPEKRVTEGWTLHMQGASSATR